MNDKKRTGKKITICKECGHHLNLESRSVRKNVWYNQLCKASPLPLDTDPISGKKRAFTFNEFGNKYFTDFRFQYCRDINKGECQKFLQKQ